MLQAAAALLITATPHVVRAAETADDNRRKCRQLDDRARGHRAILRARVDRGGVTEPVWTRLQMLKAAVDDAIRLVKSCHRRENGLVAWAQDLLASESMANKLQEADTRITACVGDLNFAESYVARHRDDRRRARVEAAPKQQRYHAQPARHAPPPPPPPPLQRISAPPPRQHRHVVQPAGSTVAVAPLRQHHRGVVQHRSARSPRAHGV